MVTKQNCNGIARAFMAFKKGWCCVYYISEGFFWGGGGGVYEGRAIHKVSNLTLKPRCASNVNCVQATIPSRHLSLFPIAFASCMGLRGP